MRLPSALARLVDQTRALGLARVARIGPRWFLRREFSVLVRDLAAPLPDVPPRGALVLTAIAEGNLLELERMDPARSASDVRQRLAQGHEGFLWSLGDRPAHYYWVTRRPVRLPYLGRRFHPEPGDVLVLDVFTHPEFRRRGIDTLSSVEYLHRARAAGLQRLIALVAPWNTPALRVAEGRMSAVPVGSIGVRHLLVTRRHFATGLVRLEGSDGFRVLSGIRGS